MNNRKLISIGITLANEVNYLFGMSKLYAEYKNYDNIQNLHKIIKRLNDLSVAWENEFDKCIVSSFGQGGAK